MSNADQAARDKLEDHKLELDELLYSSDDEEMSATRKDLNTRRQEKQMRPTKD